MVNRTLAKVPSGMRSPIGGICGWAVIEVVHVRLH
jgi:hypothetical protein